MTFQSLPGIIGLAGGEHSLYRNSNGQLYSAGGCGLGWCRLQDLHEAMLRWRSVPFPEPISLVHAGYYHNLAVGATTGKLYTWGCGTFASPTDKDDDDAAAAAASVANESSSSSSPSSLDGVITALGPYATTDRGEEPRQVPIPGLQQSTTIVDGSEKEHIAGISSGAYHSIVHTQPSGLLYTFGAGQLGQLGRRLGQQDSGETTTTTTTVDESNLPVDPIPRPVEGLPKDDRVMKIAAGFYNTFAICQSKSLYCAGENQNQQCGTGPKNLSTMTHVKDVQDVDQVAGGYCHTLIKDTVGRVFSMGCGEDGQRGDGLSDNDIENDDNDDHNNESQRRPVVTSVALPGSVKAKQVAAGANHSVILGTDGVAYPFGANDVGQCGIVNDNESIWAPTAVPTSERISHVSAGYAHTVLTTRSGRLLVFGQNDNGQLGFSNMETTSQPMKSNVG